MKQLVSKAGLPLIILLVSIVVMMVFISSKKPPEQVETPEKAFLVNAEPVYTEDLNYVVNSQGTVVPRIRTELSAQVSGKVVSVADSFVEGGMFRKGDVLVQLEQADFITDLKTAEADLSRAKAALEEEQARGKVAEEEWRTVKGNLAPELGLRKPQLAREMANVRAAEAQVERARRNLERTSIRAPYDGLVRTKQVDLGQFVSLGGSIGTLFSTDVAEVRMPLSDNDLAFLKLPGSNNAPAKVTLRATVAGEAVSWQGELARDEGVLDEQRRVIYAIAKVEDPYQRNEGAEGVPLKFGRFVQAEIVGDRAEGVVVLSRDHLRLDGTLLVVDEDRKLRIREVTVQRADARFVYISDGLRAGELVATSAVPNPYDGMTVRLPGENEDENDNGDVEDESATAIAATGGDS